MFFRWYFFSMISTCIQAKQTKQSPGKHSTRVATQPYQGLSVDFSFSGIKSSNSERRKDYEGINGETAWILISDHFTGMKHGDTRISKAAPLHWLKHFFSQYNPKCPGTEMVSSHFQSPYSPVLRSKSRTTRRKLGSLMGRNPTARQRSRYWTRVCRGRRSRPSYRLI